jgi:protein phosphatase
MTLLLPNPALVLLVGPTSSGKSTFARQHFRPTEVVSSDACRALVSDDENDQSATPDAFEVLELLVEKRLKRHRTTVVDATNLRSADRRVYVEQAQRFGVPAVALVFDLPEEILLERHRQRGDRPFAEAVIEQHRQTFGQYRDELIEEGYHDVFHFTTPEEVAALEIERVVPEAYPDAGPFDLIGDVHGCLEELLELLDRLGYRIEATPDGPLGCRATAPEGRQLVFVGDLVDRGPDSAGVLRLVMSLARQNRAQCVPGNHDDKLLRKLRGRNVQLTNGLAETLEQLRAETPEFVRAVRNFLDDLPSHLVLDAGRLVVAHAGLPEHLHGKRSAAVRAFCLYGETTGQTDEFGLPVRGDWYARYRGEATVVYGHTPVQEPHWINRTIDIDTGCAFGGKLTALRYPELELVSVPARRPYAVPARPLRAST